MNKNTLTWVLVALAVVLVLYMMYKKNDSGEDAGTSKSKLLGGSSSGSSGGSSSGSSATVTPRSPMEEQKQWIFKNIGQSTIKDCAATAGWYMKHSQHARTQEDAYGAAIWQYREESPAFASLGEHVCYEAVIGHINEFWSKKGQDGERYRALLNDDGKYFIGIV